MHYNVGESNIVILKEFRLCVHKFEYTYTVCFLSTD